VITFWVVCAVFIAIALAFVLPSLLARDDKSDSKVTADRREANIAVYRDQLGELEADLQNGVITPEQHDQDRDEIERRLLDDVSDLNRGDTKVVTAVTGDRGFAFMFALALAATAVVLYLRVGNLQAMSESPPASSISSNVESPGGGDGGAAPPGGMSQQQIEKNVAGLAKRLEGNPNDLAGWTMLARSYSSMDKYQEASAAYAKAIALKADDADLWADYAFASAMANGRKLDGPALEFVNKSLKLDPNNPKALDLAGSAAFQSKNYKQALEYWQRLMQKTDPKSEMGQAISDRIKEAQDLSGGKGAPQS
jgi:cytochrome c-type biogenesis protein CcmH